MHVDAVDVWFVRRDCEGVVQHPRVLPRVWTPAKRRELPSVTVSVLGRRSPPQQAYLKRTRGRCVDRLVCVVSHRVDHVDGNGKPQRAYAVIERSTREGGNNNGVSIERFDRKTEHAAIIAFPRSRRFTAAVGAARGIHHASWPPLLSPPSPQDLLVLFLDRLVTT
jgi:hypothetical protein